MTADASAGGAGLFSELARASRGLAKVARARPGAILVAVLAALALPSCACLVGFALVPLLGAFALGMARDALTGERSPFAARDLVVASAHGLVPLGALLAEVAAARYAESASVRAAGLLVGAGASGALFGLVAGVTFHALGGAPLTPALERALGDTVRVGLGPRALAGAVIALLTVGLPGAVLLFATEATRGFPWPLFGLWGGVGVGLVWTLALGAPIDARASESAGTPSSLRAQRLVARVLGLGAPVLGIVGAAVALAAARPSPAHSAPRDDELSSAHELDESAPLPGAHGLRVRRVARGVSIEAADGGGAGPIDFGLDLRDAPPIDDRRWVGVAGSEAEGWIVFARALPGGFGPHRLVGVRFDARGVRTDDGLLDRIAWRFGELGLGLLLAALALCVPFLVALARSVGGAVMLDRGSTGGPYVAWSGRLEVDEGIALEVTAGRLRATGSAGAEGARLVRDGGDGVVSLAPDALVLGVDGRLPHGARATIVARRSRLGPLGPRSGAAPWPGGAWLVVGSLTAAEERIVRAGVGAAALFGVPAALAALVACALSLLSS